MRFLLLAGCLLLAGQTFAQTPQYAWARLDGTVSYTSGVQNARQVVAAYLGTAFWGTIQNRKATTTGANLGDYRLAEIDSTGATTVATMVTGKLALLQVEADTAGNWYILGTYKDSVRFANGVQLLRSTAGGESSYFLARLQRGTLQPNWLVRAGSNDFCRTECFAMNTTGLYFPIDSAGGTSGSTSINRLQLATGARTLLWKQTGSSYTTSINADAGSNIYLQGNCVGSTGINFNGTSQPVPVNLQYPWYAARYKAGGQLHWNHYGSDITCSVRGSQLEGANALFVSGPLSDSTTFAGHQFSKPPSPGSVDYLLVRLDSNGVLQWAHQRPTGNTGGHYGFQNRNHAAVADSNLYLFCSTDGYPDWTGGVTTTGNGKPNGTLVQVSKTTGSVNSARALLNTYSISQQIATDGYNLWITGVGRDSTALHFDSVMLAVPPLVTVPFLAKVKLPKPPVPTGIANVAPGLSFFTVAPNPAGQMLTVHSEKGLPFRLLDAAGSTVLSGAFKGGRETLSVSHLPRGFYLLEGISAGSKQVQRVVLE